MHAFLKNVILQITKCILQEDMYFRVICWVQVNTVKRDRNVGNTDNATVGN